MDVPLSKSKIAELDQENALASFDLRYSVHLPVPQVEISHV